MAIKLIASDLDGTLLLNGAQDLRPDTCGYIRQLSEMGVIFFAASGRQYYNLQNLFAPVKDLIGYICENGCVSFFRGERLSKSAMNRKTAREIIRGILGHGACEVMASCEEVCYIQPKNEAFHRHIKDTVKYNVLAVHDILAVEEDYLKIAVYEHDGNTDFRHWQENFGTSCDVVTSGREWIDFMPHGVNKGSALRHVLDVLGISPSECMAIGDNDNDREMMELAGYPVAVVSAKPQIRALAEIETDTVENLMLRIIQGRL